MWNMSIVRDSSNSSGTFSILWQTDSTEIWSHDISLNVTEIDSEICIDCTVGENRCKRQIEIHIGSFCS